jgi:hypothetical protein
MHHTPRFLEGQTSFILMEILKCGVTVSFFGFLIEVYVLCEVNFLFFV